MKTNIKQLLIVVIPILLCACSERAKTLQNSSGEQPLTYTTRYKEKHIERMNSLSIEQNGKLVESFYFNKPQKFITHKIFNISLYNQFEQILKKGPSLNYSEAEQLIKVRVNNYFSSDCDSIENFFKTLERFDPTYTKTQYGLKLNSPTYKYIYNNTNSPITHILITAIEEHPIINLSNEAKQAIDNCSHPKKPPKI